MIVVSSAEFALTPQLRGEKLWTLAGGRLRRVAGRADRPRWGRVRGRSQYG
jgi:hypothetical protein